MKRKLIIGLFLFFDSFSVGAQTQNTISIITGGHQSSVLEKSSLPVWSYNGSIPDWDLVRKDYSSRISFHAGLLAQIRFSEKSGLYFESGIVYYNKGRKFDFSADTLALKKRLGLPDTLINSRYNFTQEQSIGYIEVPLHLVYKFRVNENAKITIGGGPSFSFFFNGHDNKTHEVEQIDTRFEKNEDLPVGEGKGQYLTLHFSANIHIGFEFKGIFIRADYSRSPGSFYKSEFYEGKFYHQVIGGTLGFFLRR
ncbi:MAG: outer membrane beta-barrel protein [Chitinophagaceae bacterium]|nr:outer membrane beta-barrel protein [Chitinophagaceae bacterium]